MPKDRIVQHALDEGARRSREASSLSPAERAPFEGLQVSNGNVTTFPANGDPAPHEALTPELLWRRYKWPLVGLGLFLLFELMTLGKLGSIMGRHF